MTNLSEKELELRMALARGECVEDEQGEVYKWDDKLIFCHWWAGMWVMVTTIEELPDLGSNSKVVPDPSADTVDCYDCGTHDEPFQHCEQHLLELGKKMGFQPPSITYDEALRADYVSILWPGRDYGRVYSRLAGKWWPSAMIIRFKIAELCGYRMEAVEG